jgi:hypothetical protein
VIVRLVVSARYIAIAIVMMIVFAFLAEVFRFSAH